MNFTKAQNRFLQVAIVLMITFLASCAPESTEEIVADYSGTWTCNESTSNPAGSSSYSVKLKKVGTSTSEYKIENFYNLGFNNEAAVNIGASSITMASQTIGAGNSAFAANGSGTVSSSTKFSMSYKMDDGSGAIDNCTANFTKQ